MLSILLTMYALAGPQEDADAALALARARVPQLVVVAPADDGFAIWWDANTYTKGVNLPGVSGDLGKSVSISGPWHNGRTVVYETLSTPTLVQIKAALAAARQTWAAEKAVSRLASPFAEHPPRHADGSSKLPVGSREALDEVNAKRAGMGLKPFARDDGLTIGAAKCAAHLAARLSSDHTYNDFAFLPNGSSASAGGLGVADTSWGWISCCYRENWTTAGAAYVWRSDGQRTMYIFVK